MTTHLNLEAGQHPDRSYFSTLLATQPQFSAEHLTEEVQAEILYWTGLLTVAPVGPAFALTFDNIEHAVGALRHESDALKDVAKALRAHGAEEWADASNYYTRVISDLHFALTDWCFALSKIGDDTPFDHYRGTIEERKKHKIAEPPRASLEDMQQVSPHLMRCYRNLDRVMTIGLEVVQRQMTVLTHYMSAAEAQAYSPEKLTEAIGELCSRWGYRDITALMTDWYQQQEQEHPEDCHEKIYLAILQTPKGGPVYCRTAKRLLQELGTAREAGVEYPECPAPSPEGNMWLVVGNFEVEEDR